MTPPSVEGKIRALERKLVRERAYLAILASGDAVMLRWDDFAASGQDALFLLHQIGADKIGLPTLGAAAVEVAARAVLQAVRLATGLGGIPAVSELGN